MFEAVNEVAVIGTTFFMMASATVWFSPLLFGKGWLSELRATEAEIEASRKHLARHLGLTFASYAVILTVLGHVVAWIDNVNVTLMTAALGITAMVLSLLCALSLWENKSTKYFLISGGFYAYFVIIGMYMIAYWPW